MPVSGKEVGVTTCNEHGPAKWFLTHQQPTATIVFFEAIAARAIFAAIHRITNDADIVVQVKPSNGPNINLAPNNSVDVSSQSIVLSAHGLAANQQAQGEYMLLCCALAQTAEAPAG